VQLLPAGVPRSLRHLPRRIAGIFEGAPVLFLGVVLGIALVFRLGIGLLRPAPADAPEASATMTAPATMAPRALPTSTTVDPDPHPKGHLVDPPPATSGRLRTERTELPVPAPPRKKRGPAPVFDSRN